MQLKYHWITLPQHEFMSSVEVTQSFGRAGTTGIESGYDTTTVSGFFGKGSRRHSLGPDPSLRDHRRARLQHPEHRPIAGGSITTWSGGLTLQYSIPYLQSQIKDYGLTGILANLTPLVELAWTLGRGRLRHPAHQQSDHLPARNRRGLDRHATTRSPPRCCGRSTAPPGTTSARSAQFHLYFDDLMPNTLGKPISEW